MTNETRQPNANERRQAFTEATVFTEPSDAVMALITACSEVAPGPTSCSPDDHLRFLECDADRRPYG
jgi:hypothetical protein